MKFIKWYLKESWFHIIWILGMLGYVITWYPGGDKTIAIIFISLIFTVLTVGKFRYWFKNLK
jgi:hypothetical protein